MRQLQAKIEQSHFYGKGDRVAVVQMLHELEQQLRPRLSVGEWAPYTSLGARRKRSWLLRP